MFTDKTKIYLRFAISNDMKYLEVLLGIKFVQTPEEAGISAQNLQDFPYAMPYLDVPLLALKTWPSKIAGYDTMTRINDLPGLALIALACGSMENTYKQLGAILVKTIELAKGGTVRGTDTHLLEFYEETQSAPFFKD